MESTRFTTEDIETSRLPRIPRRRRRRSCCSSCNSQIVCSYLIALISSILVVSGVYLAVTQWNRIWLIISVSGFLLTLFGSCLYYCGTQSLVNSYPHSDQDSYDYEEEDCDNDETHFPHSRHQTRDRGRKKRRKRGRPSPPDYVTRSLSQLSLNMIPQYFSPADTSFIRIPPGHLGTSTGLGTSTSLGTSTNLGTSTSLGGCDPSTVSAGVGTITNSHNPVPVSQIFSVNGQSYLILPLNNDSLPPPTLSSGGGTVGGGTDASTGLGRTLVGRQSENLLRLPLHEFPGCPEVITESVTIWSHFLPFSLPLILFFFFLTSFLFFSISSFFHFCSFSPLFIFPFSFLLRKKVFLLSLSFLDSLSHDKYHTKVDIILSLTLMTLY